MFRKLSVFGISFFLLYSCHRPNSRSGKPAQAKLLKESFSGGFSSEEGATQMKLTLLRDSGASFGTFIFKHKHGYSRDSIFSNLGKFEIHYDTSGQGRREIIRLNPDKIHELQDYLFRNDSLLPIFPDGKIAFGKAYSLHK